MAGIIYQITRDDNMSRAIASALSGEGYCKLEWISVEERLPEEGKTVLAVGEQSTPIFGNVFMSDKVRKNKVRYGEYYAENEWEYISHVTHWMPLSEPLKGGAE